jgi:hypothetical protein
MSTIGRPTSFHPDLCREAHNYCLLGATNDELAAFFEVSPRTIDNWIARHADFQDAVKAGRAAADARIACSLYTRALGYDRELGREILHKGELITLSRTVHYPAHPQSCIFWLRNRRPQTWGNRRQDPAPAGDDVVDEIALLDAAGEAALHHDGA